MIQDLAWQIPTGAVAVFIIWRLMQLPLRIKADIRQEREGESPHILEDSSHTDSAEHLVVTQEHIAERLSFIQQLCATEEQLVKNIHYNIEGSAAHQFTRFCQEPDASTFIQQDNMATISVRQTAERFQNFTRQALEFKERGLKLTASTITDDDIRNKCNNMSQAVWEYRHLVDDWMKFMVALAERGVPKFWEKPSWSEHIHNKLADDYDELMELVKNLRKVTPRAFQNLLPKDDQCSKFPRVSPSVWG